MQQFVQRAVRPLVFSALLSLSALAGTGTANALVVLSGSEVLDNIAPANGVTGVSIDRVLSDGFASRWDFVKAYPGTTQANGPFADSVLFGPPPFDAYVISFAPNATQQIYYEIKFTILGNSPTSAAYLDAFDPMNVATNYLGDIGGPVMNSTYQVIVPPGHSLAVAFLDDGSVPNFEGSSYTFSIAAFSDPNRGENFAADTPLPAALPLFATGLGALGLLGWRRKRKAAALAA